MLKPSHSGGAHRHRAWLHVAMLFTFMLVNYADKAVIGLSSVPIMRDLGLTNTQFGELGSAFFLLFSLSGVAGGFVANHMRTKTLLCAMALIWAAALLPITVISSFGLLLASRIVLGAAEGPAFPVALHAVYKWFEDRHRAVPTSVVASGAAFGTGIIAPVMTGIIVRYGWHTAFGVLGGAGLLWAAIWLKFAREGAVDAENSGPSVGATAAASAGAHAALTRVPYRLLLCSRTALGVFIAGFAAYWIIALNITWLGNYLIRALHVPPATAAWIIALPAFMQMVLAPCVAAVSQVLIDRGWSSRVARGILGTACVILAGVSMVGMALLPVGFSKIVLIGLSFSAASVIFTLGSTLIGEISPLAQRGAMLGITNSVHTLAGLCAPLVMGHLVDVAANSGAGFRTGYLYAGVLVTVLGSLAAVLIQPQADLRRFREHVLE